MPKQACSIGVLFLTPLCNMSCTFCITDDALSTMRCDQALRLLDFVAARSINSLVIGGGEPFMWPHGVLRLAREAKRRGFVVQVGTNGLAMPAGYEYTDAVDRYVLPLDAPDAATHNRLRKCEGGHHRVILDRLERLAQAGKEVTVSTVVNAQNLHGLPDLGRFLQAYAARGGRLHAWHLYRFIPEGRGGAVNAHRLRLSEKTYDEACAEVKDMRLGFTIYKRKDMRHSKTVDFFWYSAEEIVVGSDMWSKGSGLVSCIPKRRLTLAPYVCHRRPRQNTRYKT